MKKRLLIMAVVPGVALISLLLSGCYTQLGTVHDEEYTNQEQEQYTDTTGTDTSDGNYAYDDDYYARNRMYFDYYYPSSFYFGSAFYNPWYWHPHSYVYYDPFGYGYYPVYNPGWWYPYSGYSFYGGHAYGGGRYATGVTRNFGNTRGVGLTRGGVNASSGTYGVPPSGTRSVGRTSATAPRPGLTKSSSTPLPGARVSSGKHTVNRGNGTRGGQTINRGGSTRSGSRGSGQHYSPPPSTRGQGGGNRGGGEGSSGGRSYSPPPSAPSGGSSGGSAPSNGGSRGGNRR